MYLLDTVLISELGRAKSARADERLKNWVLSLSRQSLFISALSLIELSHPAEPSDSKQKQAVLRQGQWVREQVLPAFEGRIVAIDATIALKATEFTTLTTRNALMAASASVHSLILVTRQPSVYKSSRIKLLNPLNFDLSGLNPEPMVSDSGDDWRLAAKSGPLWLKNLFLRL